tara:strand:+ start:1153 stop:1296 length:144 start_codon:yes stop_codon:yes gene_type:complete
VCEIPFSIFFYKDSRTKAFSLISLLKSTKDPNAIDLFNQNYTFDEKY